jgi:hypothetical protein
VFSYTWIGSSLPEELRGVATFKVASSTCTISLASFKEAKDIADLIDYAIAHSKDVTLSEVENKFSNLIDSM